MEGQYEDASQFLPGIEYLQQYDPLCDPDIDPTLLLSDSSDLLNYFPPLPSLDGLTGEAETHSSEKELEDMRARVDALEKGTLDYLRTYLANMHPWMLEVTEALDKLGQAPQSATELEFPEKNI
ncbi:uncharacterized protein LDX57_001970 [Aspergillus melleus]|uniref:uncharacterized protein n=1 Tax=Aspergillus melleus TaxID=138277 RepID=UPI001E8D7708|nr:uncharacterized protein LDX57_001970 [Aspergillus melleus]KAH8424213.1 hypothetical protein LDX57_001970 [Aspergillus melleus]